MCTGWVIFSAMAGRGGSMAKFSLIASGFSAQFDSPRAQTDMTHSELGLTLHPIAHGVAPLTLYNLGCLVDKILERCS